MRYTVAVLVILVAGAPAGSFAQVPTDCPTVLITAAAEVNGPDPAQFQASIKGGSADAEAAYNWSVSAGTIIAGQGTSQIMVDTNGLAAGEVINASVQVLGYPGSCDTEASASIKVVRKAYKVFEGAYTDDAELARLLSVLIEKRVPDGKSYVVFYAGNAGPAGEVDRLKAVAKAHIESQGQDLENFPFLDGGQRDRTTIEFWMAGPGDDAPALGAAN